MKRAISILFTLIFLCLTGCAAAQEEVPEPTPDPRMLYCGDWTAELGDGSVIWQFYEGGQVLIPEQNYDRYRSLGGYGTWELSAENAIDIQLADTVTLHILEEDGFVKLYCPLLNVTLVRCEQKEGAYAAKFVDVTLTDANFSDYFYLEQVPSPVDENGQRIYKEVFVMRSGVYDDGLVFWAERDVDLNFTYWTTYRLRAEKAPYGVNFYVDDYNSITAKGTLTFVKSDYVSEYTCNGDERTVVLRSGERISETFDGFRYDGYPY